MSMEKPQLTAIKVAHNGEIHRIRVDLASFKLEDLHALFESTFSLVRGTYGIQYKDTEGDLVTVKSSTDFDEACRFFLSSSDSVKSLRFVAVPTSHMMFQENVAEPILKLIEQLVHSLNEAMSKVKEEQWATKAQENARQFASKAHENAGEWATQAQVNAGVWSTKAKEAVNTTGDVLSEKFAHTSVLVNEKLVEAGAVLGPIANKTVEESKAAFEAAKKSVNEIDFDKIKQSLNEIEFDRLMKDASDGVKTAADVATTYAQNLVQELNKLKARSAESTVETSEPAVEAPQAAVIEPTPQVAEAVVVVVPVEEVAATPVEDVASAAEADWEQVQDESASPVDEKWGAQLALIREVFPTAETSTVVALLEAVEGDVHVVLNQLVDM